MVIEEVNEQHRDKLDHVSVYTTTMGNIGRW